MGFTPIKAPLKASDNRTGISLSLLVSKKAAVARLSVTARVQEEIFGGPIAGRRFEASVGRGQDEGRLLLVEKEGGALEARKSVAGSAMIRMVAWDLLPKDKRAGAEVRFLEAAQGGWLFLLPDWTRPSLVRRVA